jgi:hypothetical protein
MADEAQDVIENAEPTAETSSVENETAEVETEAKAEEETKASKTVPYERFAEVNNNYKKMEARLAEIEAKREETKVVDPQEQVVKTQLDKYLKEMGYVSKEDLARQDADKALQDQVKNLQSKYDGKDGKPKFKYEDVLDYAEQNLIGNLEIAYKQKHEAELMDFAIKQALGKTKGVKSEVSDGSGSQEVGTTQGDLKEAALSGDEDARRTLIKRAIS